MGKPKKMKPMKGKGVKFNPDGSGYAINSRTGSRSPAALIKAFGRKIFDSRGGSGRTM